MPIKENEISVLRGEQLYRAMKMSERVAIEIPPNKNNIKYLKTKKEKMGHILEMV